jgi:hypothetical protein
MQYVLFVNATIFVDGMGYLYLLYGGLREACKRDHELSHVCYIHIHVPYFDDIMI